MLGYCFQHFPNSCIYYKYQPHGTVCPVGLTLLGLGNVRKCYIFAHTLLRIVRVRTQEHN